MYTESTQKCLRASEIARDRKSGRPGVLPISLATWWAWVKSGKAPQPIKLSPGVTVWRQTDVIAFAERLRPMSALTRAQRMAIADARQFHDGFSLRLHSRLKALDTLARHLGLF